SFFFFFSSRRRHTRFSRDWSSDVCSSDLASHYFGDPAGIIRARIGDLEHYVSIVSGPADGAYALVASPIGAVDDMWRSELSLNRSEERRVGKEWRARGTRWH